MNLLVIGDRSASLVPSLLGAVCAGIGGTIRNLNLYRNLPGYVNRPRSLSMNLNRFTFQKPQRSLNMKWLLKMTASALQAD